MNGRPPPSVSPKAIEHGRNFLAALFMAARTAQIHDPSNQAFEQAMHAVSKAAQALFQVTGGFSVRFVDDSVFLNGVRLRFEGGTYSSTQTLRKMLGSKGLGGLELHKTPSPAAIRKLVLLFAPQVVEDPKAAAEALLGEFRMLGIQRFQDRRSDVRIDRRVMVVQSYGKLILALRERFERLELRRATGGSEALGPPRLKPVRVVQDLVELCEDRADFLLRLSTNRRGAPLRELFGVNTSLLSLVAAHTLGVGRQDLVDIGLAALFVPLGISGRDDEALKFGPDSVHVSVAHLLADSGISPSTYARSIIVGEQCGLTPLQIGAPPHPYASLVRCVCAYQQLVTGVATTAPPLHPLAALATLNNDRRLGVDPRYVDLLINVLRAYPKGAIVVLEDGREAEVLSQLGGTRYDRPMVRTRSGADDTPVDLMLKDGERFVNRIQGTALFVGRATEAPDHLDVESPRPEAAFDDLPPDERLPDVEQVAVEQALDDPIVDEANTGVDPWPRGALEPTLNDDEGDPLQLPLLGPEDVQTHRPSDMEIALYAPPEPPPLNPAQPVDDAATDLSDIADMANDLDSTQADPFDPTKTQESFVPIPWDD